MCLITEQTEPIILEKDLIVFKTVRNSNGCITPVHILNFVYMQGVKNPIVKLVPTKELGMFADTPSQMHYKHKFISARSWDFVEGLVSISEGYHSFQSLERLYATFWRGLVSAQFTIPAGSEIYYDATGLIVSNQIIFNKLL